jgi:signal transduction histidine kinase
MTIGASGSVIGPEQAHLRLQHLYEISKLFASFENIERTVDPALTIATKTLPLRSAILTEAEGERSTRVVWRSEGLSTQQLQRVTEHVDAAHNYLVGAAPLTARDLSERAGKTAWPRPAETEGALGPRFIIIPLVVPHGPPFGTLALEGARALDKTDLMFVNAIANQLAIALDRDRSWQRDIARREQAEKGRTHAEVKGATAERDLLLVDSLLEKSEALAADNARLFREAQQAVRDREQILAIVSHDLRNPLGTILLTAGILSKKVIEEERRRGLPLAVGRIKRAAERMLRLIEDLLDFASIEAGQLAINRQWQHPGAMIDETLASFEAAAQEKRLQLTAEIQPDLPQVCCDRDRILQVLSNLVGNATKVTEEGGHITLRVAARENEIVFTVSDDGPGFGQEDLAHLFERYWRSDDAQYKGTGLGLAIAGGIVAAHGGRIWAESEIGKGATFRFTVPATAPDVGLPD